MLSFLGEDWKGTFPDMQCLRYYIIISKKATPAYMPMKEERDQNQDLDRKSCMIDLKSSKLKAMWDIENNLKL